MKKTKAKGMTLVEIIVAIAILGIIAMFFLGTFVFGMKGIMNAGKNTKAGYTAQQGIENKIINTASTPAGVSGTIPEPNKKLVITFKGSTAYPIEVNGDVIKVNTTNEYKAEASVFIPK